jgi:hypothetical protein
MGVFESNIVPDLLVGACNISLPFGVVSKQVMFLDGLG